MTVAALYEYLTRFAPAALSAPWDHDGVACCTDETRPVRRVLVALDATDRVVKRAAEEGFDLLLTHHPLLFRGIDALTPARTVPRKVLTLCRGDVTAISLHTRLDAAEGGVNDVLAEVLGLQNVVPFGPEGEEMGRIGTLPERVDATVYAQTVCEKLNIPALTLCGNGSVSRVAVLGGEGGDLIEAAKAAGAELFLSGRIGYHKMLDAAEEGMILMEAGHFATEVPVLARLAALVKAADPAVEVEIDSAPTVQTVTACGKDSV